MLCYAQKQQRRRKKYWGKIIIDCLFILLNMHLLFFWFPLLCSLSLFRKKSLHLFSPLNINFKCCFISYYKIHKYIFRFIFGFLFYAGESWNILKCPFSDDALFFSSVIRIIQSSIIENEEEIKSTLIQLMTYINETFHFRATLFSLLPSSSFSRPMTECENEKKKCEMKNPFLPERLC